MLDLAEALKMLHEQGLPSEVIDRDSDDGARDRAAAIGEVSLSTRSQMADAYPVIRPWRC